MPAEVKQVCVTAALLSLVIVSPASDSSGPSPPLNRSLIFIMSCMPPPPSCLTHQSKYYFALLMPFKMILCALVTYVCVKILPARAVYYMASDWCLTTY